WCLASPQRAVALARNRDSQFVTPSALDGPRIARSRCRSSSTPVHRGSRPGKVRERAVYLSWERGPRIASTFPGAPRRHSRYVALRGFLFREDEMETEARLFGSRFRAIRSLKVGHGAQTLLASDLQSGADVVVKTFDLSAVSPELGQRLLHEAHALREASGSL